MNEEELREVIKAKNKPIRDVLELSKYFVGRRNGIVYVTESLRIDLDKRMSSLGRLKVENEELRKEIEELKAKIEFKTFGDLDNPEFEDLYISKDKIKDKIKELKKDLKEYKEEYPMWCYDLECLEDIRVKEARIYVLQELLEIDDIDFDIEED